MPEHALTLRDTEEAQALFGKHDQHLRRIEQMFGVSIVARGDGLKITGPAEAIERAGSLLSDLLVVVRSGAPLRKDDVDYAIRAIQDTRLIPLRQVYQERIDVPSKRRFVIPRTPGQKAYVEAMRSHDIVFSIGPAGTGKCVAGSTLILTNRGVHPIQSLGKHAPPGAYAPIDCRIAGIGGSEPASHVYHGGVTQTRKIRTKLGFQIEVTPEHPLLTLGEDGQMRWVHARELAVGQHVAIQRGQRLFGQETTIDFHYRPNSHRDHAKPVTVDRLDEDLAYFLGTMTGDGCLTSKNRVIISSADAEILAAFNRIAARFQLHIFPNGGDRPYDYIIASSQLYQLLLHLGMSSGPAATKRVPPAILCAPEPLIVAFLQGLFDTDGTVNRRDGYPQLSSVSEQLLHEVQFLLLNLGILSNKRPKWTWYRDERRLSYQLEMTGAEADHFYKAVGFRLRRKQALQRSLRRNTNVDVIPHVRNLVRTATSAGVFSRAIHKTLDDYKTGRRRPSYEALGHIVSLLEQGGIATIASTRLAQLYDRRFFWAEIEEITEGEADVYDLTVPDSHSFCANGFVNHNTYLAMAMAVEHLTKGDVSRIILTRPAVEAGERLGYLPGSLEEKINPYLRPLYDALYEMMEVDMIQRYIDRNIIEVAPLAYMRGRTLNDSFIVLDEAQNTTSEQMKMFLTRLGFDSKAVITGDITQVDLPTGRLSGLIEVQGLLSQVPGIKFVQFSGQDVVRHELVQAIIQAYDQQRQQAANGQ